MKQMLKEGYTPEYVSLVKWQELRRKVLDGENYSPWDIGSSTCALCETVKPFFNGCGECSLNQLFGDHDPGLSCVGAWRKVNQSDSDRILASITNMVNCLQVLVLMYGVKKEE